MQKVQKLLAQLLDAINEDAEELSDEALAALEEARDTPRDAYIPLE